MNKKRNDKNCFNEYKKWNNLFKLTKLFALTFVLWICVTMLQTTSFFNANNSKQHIELTKVISEKSSEQNEIDIQLQSLLDSHKKLAYAFYATDQTYACSAMVIIKTLLSTNPYQNIDILLIIPKNTKKVILTETQQNFLKKINETSNRMVYVRKEEIPYTNNDITYRDVFLKLTIFKQFDYYKIIYLDSDALILRNLDHLFTYPIPTMGIPHACWIEQNRKEKKYTMYTTTLLIVANPNQNTWNRIQSKFNDTYHGFDMDLINEEFVSDITTLPKQYAALNSFFETEKDSQLWYDKPIAQAIKDIYVYHYTAKDKPWDFGRIPYWSDQVHSVFLKFHQKWHDLSENVCENVKH